jgi:sec-independent protein translocase protein TatA
MFGSLGPLEITLIVAVVILLFGVGKFAGLGRDLGTSIKEFRRAVKEEDPEKVESAAQAQTSQVQQPQTPPQPSHQPQAPADKSKNLF